MRKINATIKPSLSGRRSFYITDTINNNTYSVTMATDVLHDNKDNPNLVTGHKTVWCFIDKAGYIHQSVPSFDSLLEIFRFIEKSATHFR